MVLREVYPIPPSDASASYDFQDIEEGLGFVSFNAATLSGSNILTRNAVFSNDVETIALTMSGSESKDIHRNFDTSAFNLPRIAAGTASVSIPLIVQTTGAGVRKKAYTMAEIFHVRDGTATSLGKTTSGSHFISPAGGAVIGGTVQLHKIALTQKLFKKNDILRLAAEGWSVDSSDAAMGIAHDPQARPGPIYFSGSNLLTTKLIADIPFRLEL